ncbi:MAG: hypothetical protein KC800_33025 [Candidatus Eremiobacteraeota bacterium]|nr:hypothetical protein [Candidatus Eremiobacteraeota bacterium]
MKTIRFFTFVILMGLLSCSVSLSEPPAVTNITVVAHEYYDYYAMPDAEKWKKVKSVKIEGQNRAGSTQVYQCGPDNLVQATLYNVSVSSEYWVTVVWQDGEKTYRSFTASPQTEVVHHFYEPF